MKNGPKALTGVSSDDGDVKGAEPATLAASEQFSITGMTTTGDVAVILTYTDALSGLTHTDTATIHN